MHLEESDTQIFVTALNKLDNPRAKEIVTDFILNGKFLENQALALQVIGDEAYFLELKDQLDKSFKQKKKMIEVLWKIDQLVKKIDPDIDTVDAHRVDMDWRRELRLILKELDDVVE